MNPLSPPKPRRINFTAEQVRALKDGRLGQIRKPVKPQPTSVTKDGVFRFKGQQWYAHDLLKHSPFGPIGGILAVLETWMAVDLSHIAPAKWENKVDDNGITHAVIYQADQDFHADWSSPRFMPLWAVRFFLRVTGQRVERAQDVGQQDARACGIETCEEHTWSDPVRPTGRLMGLIRKKGQPNYWGDLRTAFQYDWNLRHPGSWDRNDWVFVADVEIVEKGTR